MAREFAEFRTPSYPLLTRAGPIYFNSLSSYIIKLMEINNWNKMKLLYNRNGQNEVFEDFCNIMTSSVHYDIRQFNPNIKQDYYKLDDDSDEDFILRQEISDKYGGEYPHDQFLYRGR